MTDWFRSWHGAPTDPKWRTIARVANTVTHCNADVTQGNVCNAVRPGDVAAVVWVLLDRASQAKDRGSVAGYDVEVIADNLGFDVVDVQRIIAALEQKKVITEQRFTAWDDRQPKREDDSKERVAEHRRNALKRSVTHGNSRVEESRVEERELVEHAREENSLPEKNKGTTIPLDWQPDDDDIVDAKEAGLVAEGISREASRFRDYNIANGGVMSDWHAAWRLWLSRAPDFRANGSTAPPASTPSKSVSWVEADDIRWPKLAMRWSEEHGGKIPNPVGSKHGTGVGFHFPAEWLSSS